MLLGTLSAQKEGRRLKMNPIRKRIRPASLFFGFLLCLSLAAAAPATSAQTTGAATLRGTVRDPQGNVVVANTGDSAVVTFSPAGRVLSRRALLERVWERGYFGDERIVDVHVRRLRTKIEANPNAPQLVVTVRGQGYRLDLR